MARLIRWLTATYVATQHATPYAITDTMVTHGHNILPAIAGCHAYAGRPSALPLHYEYARLEESLPPRWCIGEMSYAAKAADTPYDRQEATRMPPRHKYDGYLLPSHTPCVRHYATTASHIHSYADTPRLSTLPHTAIESAWLTTPREYHLA